MRNYLSASALALGISVFLSCKTGIKEGVTEIRTADSATIIYYERPPDSRFFKIVKVKHLLDLKPIIEDVNKRAVNNKDGCESVGKIYFYKGSEQVYVVYFSDEQCSMLSFIRNGNRYSAAMSSLSLDLIRRLKDQAKEPGIN